MIGKVKRDKKNKTPPDEPESLDDLLAKIDSLELNENTVEVDLEI